MDVQYLVYGVDFECGRHIIDDSSIRVFTKPLFANTYASNLRFKSKREYLIVVIKPIEVNNGTIPD